jgi:hypothetical protein
MCESKIALRSVDSFAWLVDIGFSPYALVFLLWWVQT